MTIKFCACMLLLTIILTAVSGSKKFNPKEEFFRHSGSDKTLCYKHCKERFRNGEAYCWRPTICRAYMAYHEGLKDGQRKLITPPPPPTPPPTNFVWFYIAVVSLFGNFLFFVFIVFKVIELSWKTNKPAQEHDEAMQPMVKTEAPVSHPRMSVDEETSVKFQIPQHPENRADMSGEEMESGKFVDKSGAIVGDTVEEDATARILMDSMTPQTGPWVTDLPGEHRNT